MFSLFLAAWVNAQLPPTPDKGAVPSRPEPRLHVENRRQEIGTVLEGDSVQIEWKLQNRGNADLVIDRTAADCGCTVVKLREEDKVIKPGETLTLTVEFNSTARHGEQNKDITIFSNDPLQPELKLTIHGQVDQVVMSDPVNIYNVRVIRRGETTPRPIEIVPTPGKGNLEVTRLEVESGAPFDVRSESFEKDGRVGARIYVTVNESAALGPLMGSLSLDFRVGELQRSRKFSVRGEVVSDLNWLPKVIDATRQVSQPGTTLAPITLTSTSDRPFQIIEVQGGPMLLVSVGPGKKGKPGTEYSIDVAINETAPPGPFGAMVRILTDSLDQPVVDVPVFALVAPKVEVEPGTVLLRGDGTDAGTRRRIRIKATDASDLKVTGVESDSPAVTAAVDIQSSARYQHIVFVDVELTGSLPQGTHRTTLRVTTDTAQKMEIPVRVEIP